MAGLITATAASDIDEEEIMLISEFIIGTVVFYVALVNGAGDDEWEDSK